jgi:hypothetical protein
MSWHHPITLCKNISALAIEADECGGHRYGLIEQLPTGETVVLVGDGFMNPTLITVMNYLFALGILH